MDPVKPALVSPWVSPSLWALAVLAGPAGCGSEAGSESAGAAGKGTASASVGASGSSTTSSAKHAKKAKRPRAGLPAHTEHDDLVSALAELVTPETRLVGIGELHSRLDRPDAPSTLARFTGEVLPALPERTSDLVLETWTVDRRCGKAAVAATAKLQEATQRPDATKNELGILVGSSKSRGIRTHRMRVTCEDYQTMAGGGDDAIVHMLDLTTAELGRLSVTALERPRPPSPTPLPPPLVVVYGGAMHNDRFPTAGLGSWSYAPFVEGASERTYVEIDLITPELAEGDAAIAAQPWAPLLGASSRVVTFRRGDRSFVVILPRAAAPAPG
jgi:hypothetical protein